jgi:DNA end-binding protein Ku
MAHAIWSGSISFGLVTIPVKLFTAVRTSDVRFNFLHKKDLGRINNVRRCSIDGEDVGYADIVRGYEYEKGRYVVLEDEDFKSVAVEATQSVEIVEFVDLTEINPMYFDTPYYLEPEKKGRHAYALLREALRDANKVGIAKVVIRSREHLAALKPNGDALVLELMHFADELVPQDQFDFPESEKPSESEMKMAMMLIDTMVAKFEPEKFRDNYREQLLAMIDARAQGQTLPKSKVKAPVPTNVVNLMDVLQKSLDASKKGGGRSAASGSKAANAAKKTPARRKRPAA